MLNIPFHFSPYLKPVIWGGNRIAPFKGLPDADGIGESWEISAVEGHVSVVDSGPYAGRTLTELIEIFGAELLGEENYQLYGTKFPLLIKFIDAQADLSVQVHPNDSLALQRHGCKGKTEMWHVISSSPDAKIYAGFRSRVTPDEYERKIADDTIMEVVDCFSPLPGDTFFIPAGCIHAIGAGCFIAEIQQSSDITYRIYDYGRRDSDGRLRELHTDLAKDAIDFSLKSCCKTEPVGACVAECDHFKVQRVELTDGAERLIADRRDSFTVVMCIDGHARINHPDGSCSEIGRGNTLLFPATMRRLSACGEAILLVVQC